MNLGLKDKVAMVGGGSKGLGLAVARALAAEGARVSIASRDASAIHAAAERLTKETGASVLGVAADLSSKADIEQWYAATVERFSGVDLLFVNTGGPPAGPAVSFSDEVWQSTFELLLLSAVRLVRLVVPSMQARGGGSILMSTSSSVKEPIANLGLSTVTRASVSALAKTLAIELAPSKIRVNQIIPGRLDTDRVRHLDEVNARRGGIAVSEQQTRMAATIPMGRYGVADEYGAAAAFLLSEAASYITGASLQVDGGLVRSVL